jgi:hypothetical protein
MKLRIGFVLGFSLGYYLGAKAGRERYQQLNRLIGKVKRSEVLDTATDKAKAVIDLGVERAKDLVESRTGTGSGHADGNGTVAAPQDLGGAPAPY